MAAVLAGEAASPRMRFLAPALAAACLLLPASAAAQLPDASATAAGAVNTATQAVAQPTAPVQPVVQQAAEAAPQVTAPPVPSGQIERATAPVTQVVEQVREPAAPATEAVTRTVEQVTAPVRQIVADDRDSTGPKVAPTAERVRHEAVTPERHARSVLAPVFRPAVGPTFEASNPPPAASAPEIGSQGAGTTAETRGKPARPGRSRASPDAVGRRLRCTGGTGVRRLRGPVRRRRAVACGSRTNTSPDAGRSAPGALHLVARAPWLDAPRLRPGSAENNERKQQ